MDKYYFTVASLPSLRYDQEPPMTREAFLEAAQASLSARDYRVLALVSLDMERAPGLSGVLDGWCAWSYTLRGELAVSRAQRLGRDTERYSRLTEVVASARDLARSLAAEPTPASAEDALLRGAWAHLDDLEVGHHFDLDKLIVYFLKLQVLDLRRRRSKEEGLRRFSEVYQGLAAGGEAS